MKKSGSSILRRVKQVLQSFRALPALKPFLDGLLTVTRAHALWVALVLLVAVGIVSFWNTLVLIKSSDERIQLRSVLIDLQETFSSLKDAETGATRLLAGR